MRSFSKNIMDRLNDEMPRSCVKFLMTLQNRNYIKTIPDRNCHEKRRAYQDRLQNVFLNGRPHSRKLLLLLPL